MLHLIGGLEDVQKRYMEESKNWNSVVRKKLITTTVKDMLLWDKTDGIL